MIYRRLPPSGVLRTQSPVNPLELFFDVVFVLALMQCTALMANETGPGLIKGQVRRPRPAISVTAACG